MSITRPTPSGDSVANLIGPGTAITGTISFSGGLRVDGEVHGQVRCAAGQAGTLIVGGKGRVDGDVEVDRVIADGSMAGRVCVKESIRVQAKAHIDCELEYAEIEIEPGAVVEGHLQPHPSPRRAEASVVAETEVPAETESAPT